MASGYLGKILRVNLSREEITVETQPEIFYRRYLGGEGIVAYYLLKELPAKVDPLSPNNMLIFAAGPLTGVALSGVSRSSVGAKSPLTGGFGESEAGGYWGTELKKAGYDGIVITGKAKKPVYLWITETIVEIKDGTHLWGKETGEAHEKIKEDHNDKNIRIALIGPGGENRVRYACILHDLHNAAGRTGLGAVMGSKNLKAIAVRGKQNVPVADKEAVKLLRKKMIEVYLKDLEHFSLLGTGGDRMESLVWTGNLPIRNFRDGEFPTIEKIDPRTMKDTFGLKMTGCYACPIRCKKIVEFTEPYEVLAKYGGPEYESLGAFGPNCGIDDAKIVCKANELCNRYSLDVISAGVTISFAMECYEKGLISEELADGLKITFGNGDVLLKLVEKIARREGLGDLLAEGVKRAAAHLGPKAEKYAMHVKGQALPMHYPRLNRA
ncbi:MAG: aldehyde ferredoxin oxidoreductase family protein, partial [Candidatus Heimdallarchaeota archaeon]